MLTITLTRKHHGAAVILAVVAIVAVSITLLVGMMINTTVQNSLSTSGWTTAENTSLSAMIATINSGYSLAGIIILVLAAAVIIGVLLRFGGLGGGGV